MVKDTWNSYLVKGNSISKFKHKKKCLKNDIKVWNWDVFGCLDTNKKRIVKEIEDLDVQDNNIDLGETAKLRRMELFSQLRVIDKKIESLYRKKARANWFKHGDINSKYYHFVIRWRRLKNEVKGVEVGNQWCEDPNVVRREVRNMFENRFKATHDCRVSLGSVVFKSLSVEVSLSMISDVTNEEVKEAIWQCEGSKSPRPDGLTLTSLSITRILLNMML